MQGKGLFRPRAEECRSCGVRENMFVDGVCGFFMCDAEEMPGTVCGFDEGVVVEVPGFRFADGRVVEFYEGAAGYFVWEWACWIVLAKRKRINAIWIKERNT
jgi:hypothetical protein